MTDPQAGTGPETVTADELTKALIHVEHAGGKGGCASCRAKAVSLLSHVRASREPEYEQDEMYQDANGAYWQYAPDREAQRAGSFADCPWLAPSGAGPFSFNTPVRPLRKLVPLPAREDLLAALEELICRESGYDGQADRVYALLEGREASDD